MAKSNGFWGKVVPGLQGANLRTVREPTCTGNGAVVWALTNGAAMWTTALLGRKDTCSVRFVLHKSLKNQRIESYVQVSC